MHARADRRAIQNADCLACGRGGSVTGNSVAAADVSSLDTLYDWPEDRMSDQNDGAGGYRFPLSPGQNVVAIAQRRRHAVAVDARDGPAEHACEG